MLKKYIKLFFVKKNENKIKNDAIVWTKKYFIIPTLLKIDFVSSNIGKKAIRFNSSPIHIINGLDEEILIVVPQIKKKKKTLVGANFVFIIKIGKFLSFQVKVRSLYYSYFMLD
jgi:hypothetical protein